MGARRGLGLELASLALTAAHVQQAVAIERGKALLAAGGHNAEEAKVVLEGAAAKAASFGLHVYEVSARTPAFFAIYLVQLRMYPPTEAPSGSFIF